MDVDSIQTWAVIRTQRFSQRSPAVPANRAKRRMGSWVMVCTSATICGEEVSSAISHAAPTPWISQPRFERRLADQS